MTAFCTDISAAVPDTNQAAQWEAFVEVSIATLRQAEQRLKAPLTWATFLSGVTSKEPTEPDLTTALFHELDAIKSEAPLESPLRDIEFQCEYPVADVARRGTRSKRADFRFLKRFGHGVNMALSVEAKKVKSAGDITKKYLGVAGIGCFFAIDSPYTREPVAAMIAYACRKPISFWQTKIQSDLAALTDPVCKLVHVVSPNVIGLAAHSVSPRNMLQLGEISILHFIVDFSS